MTKSQICGDPNQTEQKLSLARSKTIAVLLIALVIGIIFIPLIIIYNRFFPQGYRKSHELEQNQAKWESQEITHYRMSVSEYGYGVSFYVVVEVKDGVVVSALNVQNKKLLSIEQLNSLRRYEDVFTVPALFTYVAQAYHNDPPFIRVTYNSNLGYPETIYIDPYTEPCCQDFTIEVREFQILP